MEDDWKNRGRLVTQMVKNLPTVQKTRVQNLGGEDPLEKGTATHSSILVWRIPWTEKPDGLQSMGITKRKTWLSYFHFGMETVYICKNIHFTFTYKFMCWFLILYLSCPLIFKGASVNQGLYLFFIPPEDQWVQITKKGLHFYKLVNLGFTFHGQLFLPNLFGSVTNLYYSHSKHRQYLGLLSFVFCFWFFFSDRGNWKMPSY